MAPYPDSTPAESSSPAPVATHAPEESALPGMKRGIAIGVACSVGIILIALVAFFAYRRRKRQAATTQHTRLSPEEPVEMEAGGAFWPKEKAQHVQATPIEADAHTIHELDGSEVPELPGHYEGQELANKKTPRTSYHVGDEDAFGVNAEQWHNWNVALQNDSSQPAQQYMRDSNPYLEVTPMRQATSVSPVAETMYYPPAQNASFSISPIAPSPLESAHFTPPRTSQTQQQQRYYDQARTSR